MLSDFAALIAQYGALFVFANVLVEQFGMPLPAVPTLVLAGGLASHGSLSAASLVVAAVAASLLADTAWFVAGRKYGQRLMRPRCTISLEPQSRIPSTRSRFERWGGGALVLAKFVPGLSTVAAPMAGAMRMGWRPFLFFDAIGATLWSGAGVGAGMMLEPDVAAIASFFDALGNGVLVAAAVPGVGFAAWRLWQWRLRDRSPALPPPPRQPAMTATGRQAARMQSGRVGQTGMEPQLAFAALTTAQAGQAMEREIASVHKGVAVADERPADLVQARKPSPDRSNPDTGGALEGRREGRPRASASSATGRLGSTGRNGTQARQDCHCPAAASC